MYADAIARISESVFPIIFVVEKAGLVEAGVSGTGFFIGDGLFVTADHVMSDGPAGASMRYYGKLPDDVCQPGLEIEHIARDPARDLYLGRVSRDYLMPVEVSREPVRPGDAVCLAGYPLASVAPTPDGGLITDVRRYWQPTFVIDVMQAVIDNRTYDGYVVQHTCLPGMDGGPVFDMQGKVRGMAAATLTRTIPDPGGTPTVVANGMVIDVEQIRRFIADAGARAGLDRQYRDRDRIASWRNGLTQQRRRGSERGPAGAQSRQAAAAATSWAAPGPLAPVPMP
jgi:S1-C subfamily serine protease